MIRSVLLYVGIIFVMSDVAYGQTSCASYPYPYSLTNGTTASASAVMANFNQILNCANNLAPASGGTVNFSQLGIGSYAGSTAPADSIIVSGSIGVGTSVPGGSLDVSGAGVSFLQNLKLIPSSNDTYVETNNAARTANGGELHFTGFEGDSDLLDINFTSSSIIANGYFGIGTSAPTHLLQVGSATATGTVAEFQNSAGACTFTPTASSMTASCSSDSRLKKDIVDAGDAIAWLNDMSVRDFTIRTTGERATGVIAQEMLRSHPDMVHKGADGFYTVDEPNLWKLVKAIQELKAENDELRARVAALESLPHASSAGSDGRPTPTGVNGQTVTPINAPAADAFNVSTKERR